MRSTFAVLTLGGVLLLAGCASPPPMTRDKVLASLPVSTTSRLGLKVAVAPLEISESAALRKDSDAQVSPVEPEITKFEDELIDVLLRTRRFSSVKKLVVIKNSDAKPAAMVGDRASAALLGGSIQSAASDALEADRSSEDERSPEDERDFGAIYDVPAPIAEDDLFRSAFEARADILLRPRLLSYRVHFVDHNSWFVLNQINFVMNIWPAYFVADEQYAGEIVLEIEVFSVLTRKRLGEPKLLSVRCEPKDLDHFDRGWLFFGSFVTPESLKPKANYRVAGEIVLRHAQNELDEALAEYALSLAPLVTDTRGTLALCVGVGDYEESTIANSGECSLDADAFADLLTTRAQTTTQEQTPAYNVDRLRDAQPTKAKIIERLGARARRADSADDTLIFYFSGYGFQSGDELYLVPADVDPADPVTSSISLTELGKALAVSPARQVIVLDTSFGPGKLLADADAKDDVRTFLFNAGRTASLDPPGVAARALVEAFAAARKDRTVVLGTAPGSAANAEDPARGAERGFFTYQLEEAARDPAHDRSGDGWFSLQELFDRAKTRTTGVTGAKKYKHQVPELFGEEGKDIFVAPVGAKE